MFKTGVQVLRRAKLKSLDRTMGKGYATEPQPLPAHADVVIIGGGVAGCSLLYQLARRGVEVVLVEKARLTSGTTWHTGGLVWSLRPNDVDVQLLAATRRILAALEQESAGLGGGGWSGCGGLFVARSEERVEEYKRLHTLGHYFGIESHIIAPAEAARLAPILDRGAFRAALWSPADGVADPSALCTALIRAATARGARVFENCDVAAIATEQGAAGRRVAGVETALGPVRAGCVVNAAGVWAQRLVQGLRLGLPISPMKHAYVVTDRVEGARGSPSVRDHDGNIYIRAQGEALLMGGYEANPAIIKEMPGDFAFSLYELDPAVFEVHLQHAVELCPAFGHVGIKSNVCGPEAFTPDHRPILGEDPRLAGLFHSCGYNSSGMMLSGGCAEQLAIWITQGRPDLPMFGYDIRRFSEALRSDRAWITETSHESYAKNYSIVYPHDQRLAGRNHKIDPFHEALVAAGAVMEQAQGWERPGYFVKDRTAPVRGYDWYGHYDHVVNPDKRYEKELEGDYSFGFSKHHDLIGAECLATRNNVALFDVTYFSKMYLTGPDAAEVADWLFTNNVDKEPGRVIYSLSLNGKGGVEADVTVTPLQEGTGTLVGPILKGKGYYIVAGGASGYQTVSHFKKEMAKKNFKSVITDITDKLGILSVQGPKSGELLQSITETPITDEKFPVGMSHIIRIDDHVCRAMRVSFVGELGYEIHVPYASCVPVYNRIVEAGRGFDLRHAGLRALYALSLEKGYHLWDHDLRIDDNPVEASLGHVCRKEGQYLGKQHVDKMKQSGTAKRRVFFTLEDRVAVFGLETIWRDGAIVGYLRRGDYGFALDCSIGIGYVHHPKGQILTEDFLQNGTYEIEILNKRYPATMYLKSPFDPHNSRIAGKYENQFEEQQHFED